MIKNIKVQNTGKSDSRRRKEMYKNAIAHIEKVDWVPSFLSGDHK
jgi:hypothetical protein